MTAKTDQQIIAEQHQTIIKQQNVIDFQHKSLIDIRNQLLSIKKQLLINSAKETPEDFRNQLTLYLLSIRKEIESLQNTNHLSILPINETFANIEEIKSNIDPECKEKEIEITSAGFTALYIAAGRALEHTRKMDDRLFDDPFSDKFASINNHCGYQFLQNFADALTKVNESHNQIDARVTSDFLSMFVSFRAKWIDDQIYFALKNDKKDMRAGITKGTIKQIVVLGCGCDTRSFRLDKLPKDLICYNIDCNDILLLRAKVFGKEYGMCPSIEISADFSNSSDNIWMEELIDAGFKVDKKVIWILEGFLEYMNEMNACLVLETIEKNSANHSWIIGECPNLINADTEEMHAAWVKLGANGVQCGWDLPLDSILNRFGFSANVDVNILGCGDSNYYGRAPPAYVEYQLQSEPCLNDKIARILLWRGMKEVKNSYSGLLQSALDLVNNDRSGNKTSDDVKDNN